MSKIRVRFAPSPTGFVHVGNARTALFNWLFARHDAAALILRIEDTDIERSRDEYEKQLVEDLSWFGLDWDEGPDKGGPLGPYRQSERKDLYHQFAIQLIAGGHAYYCFCSPEQLESERQAALKAGQQPKYSGRCRTLAREETARRVAEAEPAAIRLQIREGELAWEDLVHGQVSFSSDVIGDFILVRSDGHPTYNYTAVIDDHLMEISQVIRGDDHISNTPRQLAVYQALDWAPPRFAHLSTILGADRARLSKRHGATSLQNFRELGVLPEALMNYLALLGWSPADGTTEIFTREELIAQFSLDSITKAPAVFDFDKLKWMNRHYMKQCSARRLAELSLPILTAAGYLRLRASDVSPDSRQVRYAPNPESKATESGPGEDAMIWLEHVIDAVLKNLDLLSELPGATRLIFEYDAGSVVSGEDTGHVVEEPASREVLRSFVGKIHALDCLDYEQFREAAKSVQKETGKKGKDLFHPIRVAVTGAVSGPELEKLIPIFEQGARLPLDPPIKSTAQRLCEFAIAADLT